jgi:hypothetical protein
MRWMSTLLIAVLVAGPVEAAVPFWGDRASRPPETDPAALEPGQFVWEGDAVTAGPIVVVVSLDDQRAYVYRNGVRIGVSTASTGKPGHATPTGVFTVLAKDKDHHSKTYGNAPMPYSERLTWDGVALHAGGLPGYPSSHGCVHLPSEFARLLFEVSHTGMTVVVASQRTAPAAVDHPAALAPVDAATGKPVDVPRLSEGEAFRWQPDKAPDGPVTILVSAADARVLVFRNGVEIGRARVTIADPAKPLGTHAFMMVEGAQAGGGAGAARPRWVAPGARRRERAGAGSGRGGARAHAARVHPPGAAAPGAGRHAHGDRRRRARDDDRAADERDERRRARGRVTGRQAARSGTSSRRWSALQFPCSIARTSSRGRPRKRRAMVTRLFGQSVPVCG